MNILYVIDSLATGGKERQLIELIKGVVKRDDINVRLIVLSDKIEYEAINDLDIDMHLITRNSRKDLSIFKKLYFLCKDYKPDIIHSWELMCSAYSLPVAKMLRVKFVNGLIRFAPQDFNVFKSRYYVLTKLTFIFSDMNISNSMAGLISYKVNKEKSRCVYNGFDINRIKNVQSKDVVRHKYDIFTKNVVGMVARFHKRKDYKSFITAAIKIVDMGADVTFLMIGEGETLKECIDLVPNRYSRYIRFLGRQQDVESLINIFDIGVLVSFEEGISNSILEYMALAKPVIATKHGGNEEIVVNNKTGFIIKPYDIDDLTEKIKILLADKDMGSRMGAAGSERIKEYFNLDRMTDSYIGLYKECVNNK